MKFTVLWSPSAEQELANIWLAADDRESVTQAASALDQQLSHSADKLGESRTGSRRIAFQPPLTILFDVRVKDSQVLVMRVQPFPKKK